MYVGCIVPVYYIVIMLFCLECSRVGNALIHVKSLLTLQRILFLFRCGQWFNVRYIHGGCTALFWKETSLGYWNRRVRVRSGHSDIRPFNADIIGNTRGVWNSIFGVLRKCRSICNLKSICHAKREIIGYVILKVDRHAVIMLNDKTCDLVV